MDLLKAELALDKIGVGLNKYLNIMSKLHLVDVSKDVEFQTAYNGFYRMRQRKPEFYQGYYEFMEANKVNELSFSEALNHIYTKFGRVEASFCSKMVATINPNQPVWDEFVLQNLGLKKPYPSSKNRLQKTIDLYHKISEWYSNFLETNDSKELIKLFNKKYPNAKITNIKKIDLVLWQMR
ncbi:hypothetical protein GC105_14900 [Alkalibaculum sp. M08DMB]|uniref:Uncharacterized protein n=1 Tax=Alkalibaculum sporogenes TaxID=2655001 RepID=A0A6A7KBZ3_9FIRM|nr:hypothetical protein [Alkalibaculum sporogenes]MPW27069.1 hypothetical protein [Alkalibaculum sporogenes]